MEYAYKRNEKKEKRETFNLRDKLLNYNIIN